MDELLGGERMIAHSNLDCQIENEHKHRYRAAAKFAAHKRVLDASCGSGYGSAILAENAASVVGIDHSAAVIDYCKRTYEKENLSFFQMSAATLEFPENSFDVVVSFEAMEYLTQKDQILFLEGIRRVLAKDGILIISAPHKGIWDRFVNHCDNTHHLCECGEENFIGVLSGYFANVDTYYQSCLPTSLIHGKDRSDTIPILYASNFVGMDLSPYVIAVCSQEKPSVDLSGMYIANFTQAVLERKFGFSNMMMFCDRGNGFSEDEKLCAPMEILKDGRLSVTFLLPDDVRALRFAPGDFACSLDELECSDPTITVKPHNGLQIGKDSYFFPNPDPIFFLGRETPFEKGEQLRFSFRYCRTSDPSSTNAGLQKAYLQLEKNYQRDIAEKDAVIAEKDAMIAQMQRIHNEICSSRSWRITNPLRMLANKLRRMMRLV